MGVLERMDKHRICKDLLQRVERRARLGQWTKKIKTTCTPSERRYADFRSFQRGVHQQMNWIARLNFAAIKFVDDMGMLGDFGARGIP